jgi:hypothetical protein
MKKPTHRQYQWDVTICVISKQKCIKTFEPVVSPANPHICSNCKIGIKEKNKSLIQ